MQSVREGFLGGRDKRRRDDAGLDLADELDTATPREGRERDLAVGLSAALASIVDAATTGGRWALYRHGIGHGCRHRQDATPSRPPEDRVLTLAPSAPRWGVADGWTPAVECERGTTQEPSGRALIAGRCRASRWLNPGGACPQAHAGVASREHDPLAPEIPEFLTGVENLAIGVLRARAASRVDWHLDRRALARLTRAVRDRGFEPREQTAGSLRQVVASVLLRVQFFDNAKRHHESHRRPAEHRRPPHAVGPLVVEQCVRVEHHGWRDAGCCRAIRSSMSRASASSDATWKLISERSAGQARSGFSGQCPVSASGVV